MTTGDCGFHFSTARMETSYLSANEMELLREQRSRNFTIRCTPKRVMFSIGSYAILSALRADNWPAMLGAVLGSLIFCLLLAGLAAAFQSYLKKRRDKRLDVFQRRPASSRVRE